MRLGAGTRDRSRAGGLPSGLRLPLPGVGHITWALGSGAPGVSVSYLKVGNRVCGREGVWRIAPEVWETLLAPEPAGGRLGSSGFRVAVPRWDRGWGWAVPGGPMPGVEDRAWNRRTPPGIGGMRLC